MKTAKNKSNKKPNLSTKLQNNNDLLTKNNQSEKKKLTIKSFYINIVITILLILLIAPQMNFSLISEWVGLILGSFLSSLIIVYIVRLAYKLIKATGNGGIF